MDEFLGIVKLFAGSFAPRGWALCDGRQLSIQQNAALFAVLGTTYGGNGKTTFNLPDLRARVAMGAGAGPDLPVVSLGQNIASVRLAVANSGVTSVPPCLALNYIICLQGIFPPRQ